LSVDPSDGRGEDVTAFIRRNDPDARRARIPAPPPRLLAHFDDLGELACAAGL
jgi:hypothetical protein